MEIRDRRKMYVQKLINITYTKEIQEIPPCLFHNIGQCFRVQTDLRVQSPEITSIRVRNSKIHIQK